MKKELDSTTDLLKWYIKNRINGSISQSGSNQFNTPLAFSFLVTNRCVLKCKHCFYHQSLNKNKENELTLSEYEKLSSKIGSFIYAFFCGGEPFIRKDIAEIINIFQKNNNVIWANSTTNGQLTDRICSSVKELVENNKRFFNLNFSLEGPQEINDLIRGKGSFAKALSSYNECNVLRKYNKNLKLGITTTMCSTNQDHLKDFFVWVKKELRPDTLNCLLIRQNPRDGMYMKDIDIAKYKDLSETLFEIRDEINNNKDNIFYHQLSTMNELVYKTNIDNQKQFHCYAGIHGTFIDYDGTVNVCEVFCDKELNAENNLSIGNLRDYDMDFLSLWNSAEAANTRIRVNKNKVCHLCTHETEGLIPSLFIEPNVLAKYIR